MPSPGEIHASDFSEVHVINIESDLDIDTPVIKVDKQDSAMNGNGERCFHFSYLRHNVTDAANFPIHEWFELFLW